MSIKQLCASVMANPWVHVIMALYIIISSSFDILKDISHLHKEHGEMIVGIIMLLKTVIEFREKLSRAEEAIKGVRHH